ncbi:MAG: universal stress protein [Candidatus Melainabacteria bacterium]|nr:MAG: universal stress protein [Candidatus Melainabacteria bacterium]
MKVLVPLDDSSYSEAALISVGARHWPARTEILLYSVVNDYDKLGKVLAVPDEQKLRRLKEEQEREVICMLQRKCDGLRRSLPEVTVSSAVGYGHPATQIVETAHRWGAQLIIMGSHGRRNVQLYALGSVTAQVIEKTPCSMEVIRLLNRSGKAWHDQRRIIVCYDGSDHSRAALDWVAHSAWAPHQEFALVSVLNTIEDKIGALQIFHQKKANELKAQAIAAAQGALDSHVERLREMMPNNAIIGHVLEGYAAESILELAEDFLADLIVIGAHSEQLHIDSAIGSVAKRIACFSRCCVKVVRAHEMSRFR